MKSRYVIEFIVSSLRLVFGPVSGFGRRRAVERRQRTSAA